MMSVGILGIVIVIGIILLILIGLGVLVIFAVRRTGGGSSGASGGASAAAHPQNAREVLDQRYARGEITREQYQQMKQDLDL